MLLNPISSWFEVVQWKMVDSSGLNDGIQLQHPTDHCYPVQIIETEASMNWNLQPSTMYKLIIQLKRIQLMTTPGRHDQTGEPSTALLKWQFKNIRRYGYTRNSLSIETGSKSTTGSGIFIFRSKQSKQIYKQINANIESLKSNCVQIKNEQSLFQSTESSMGQTDCSAIYSNQIDANRGLRDVDGPNQPVTHYLHKDSMYALVDKTGHSNQQPPFFHWNKFKYAGKFYKYFLISFIVLFINSLI